MANPMYKKYLLLILTVVVADQMIKLATHFYVPVGHHGELSLLGDWFKIHHTLNKGMAFGAELVFGVELAFASNCLRAYAASFNIHLVHGRSAHSV